ncbi:hypothetical protein ILYODFUR_003624 [Ilyodon furcidens]|uniref:Uncharacterized protein n=1 Tax=Ilyodon furcidens TaxID=33524 RepID=A0ABV0UR14_9TELE
MVAIDWHLGLTRGSVLHRSAVSLWELLIKDFGPIFPPRSAKSADEVESNSIHLTSLSSTTQRIYFLFQRAHGDLTSHSSKINVTVSHSNSSTAHYSDGWTRGFKSTGSVASGARPSGAERSRLNIASRQRAVNVCFRLRFSLTSGQLKIIFLFHQNE